MSCACNCLSHSYNNYPVCSEFVDEFPELDEIYTAIPKRENTSTLDLSLRRSKTPQSINSSSFWESATISRTKPSRDSSSKHQTKSPVKRRREDDDKTFVSSKHSNVKSYPRRPAKIGEYLTERSISKGTIPDPLLEWGTSTFFPQESNVQADANDELHQSEIQEACLLKYFADELACLVCESLNEMLFLFTNLFSLTSVTQNVILL